MTIQPQDCKTLLASSDLSTDIKRLIHKYQLELSQLQQETDSTVSTLIQLSASTQSDAPTFDEGLKTLQSRLVQVQKQQLQLPQSSSDIFPSLSKLQAAKDRIALVHSRLMDEQQWRITHALISELVSANRFVEASARLRDLQKKAKQDNHERQGFLAETTQLLRQRYLVAGEPFAMDEAITVMRNLGFEKELQETIFKEKSESIIRQWMQDVKEMKENKRNFHACIAAHLHSLESLDLQPQQDSFLLESKLVTLRHIVSVVSPTISETISHILQSSDGLEETIKAYVFIVDFEKENPVMQRERLLAPVFDCFLVAQESQGNIEAKLCESQKASDDSMVPFHLRSVASKLQSSIGVNPQWGCRLHHFVLFLDSAIERSRRFAFFLNLQPILDVLLSSFMRETKGLLDEISKKTLLFSDNWTKFAGFLDAISLLEGVRNLIEQQEKKWALLISKGDEHKPENPLDVLLGRFSQAPFTLRSFSDHVMAVCGKCQKYAMNSLMNPIAVDLMGYFKGLTVPITEPLESPKFKLPKFNHSPSAVIIKVGEDVLNLPQRLEMFVNSAGFQMRLLKGLESEENEVVAWITLIVQAVMDQIVQGFIETAADIEVARADTMQVDFEYICNVIQALQVELTASMNFMLTFWKMEEGEFNEAAVDLPLKDACRRLQSTFQK